MEEPFITEVGALAGVATRVKLGFIQEEDNE